MPKTQPVSTPAPAPAENVAAMALDRVKALHLQHRVALLAFMSIVRNSDPTSAGFDDLCAAANHLAEMDSAFGVLESELLKRLAAGAAGALH